MLAVAPRAWYAHVNPGPRHRGPLRLIGAKERELATVLEAHVRSLARDIGVRRAGDVAALERTVAYIQSQFVQFGCVVACLPTAHTSFVFPNVEVVLPGTFPEASEVVIGAHYDTVPGSPGADDNASGLAVLLELARMLRIGQRTRTVRLVAFADEERNLEGSAQYARGLKEHGVRVSAMVSLEMLGYYTDVPGSQRYPLPVLRLLYPDRGDYVACVGDLASRALVATCVAALRRAVLLPCEGLAVPRVLKDIERSDHASFWKQGWPAVMLTDTSNFRNPHYHRATDVPETLDYLRMARLTRGLVTLVERLAAP